MVLSLSSDGFFQITRQPDVHLVRFQKKYVSVYIFHLVFSDVFIAMHLQLRISCLLFWRGADGKAVSNATMNSTVFPIELFETLSGTDSV